MYKTDIIKELYPNEVRFRVFEQVIYSIKILVSRYAKASLLTLNINNI